MSAEIGDSAIAHKAITLSDSTVYTDVRGFHTNADGTLVLEMAAPWDEGGALETAAYIIKAGVYYPYKVRRFLSTGSTASATLLIKAFR